MPNDVRGRGRVEACLRMAQYGGDFFLPGVEGHRLDKGADVAGDAVFPLIAWKSGTMLRPEILQYYL